jgi:hypothetical protein
MGYARQTRSRSPSSGKTAILPIGAVYTMAYWEYLLLIVLTVAFSGSAIYMLVLAL